jgi:hypothetical protein
MDGYIQLVVKALEKDIVLVLQGKGFIAKHLFQPRGIFLGEQPDLDLDLHDDQRGAESEGQSHHLLCIKNQAL